MFTQASSGSGETKSEGGGIQLGARGGVQGDPLAPRTPGRAGPRTAAPRKGPRIVDPRDLRRYADLRRIRDSSIQDVIRHRARALSDEDRAAIEAVLIHGHHVNHIAAVMCRPVRELRTHVRRLLSRVLSAEFACVQTHGKVWGSSRRAVGESIFVRGLSMRLTAKALGIPLHAVRKHAEAVRALADYTRRAPLSGADVVGEARS